MFVIVLRAKKFENNASNANAVRPRKEMVGQHQGRLYSYKFDNNNNNNNNNSFISYRS